MFLFHVLPQMARARKYRPALRHIWEILVTMATKAVVSMHLDDLLHNCVNGGIFLQTIKSKNLYYTPNAQILELQNMTIRK